MSTDELLEDTTLRYSTDTKPGYTRKKIGETFVYFNTLGEKITDLKVIERINKLAIPPAYERVWICPNANGHLQATGIDARKRKQYRYHPLWIQLSQQEKFSRLIDFAEKLPRIRQQVRRDMTLDGMPRRKVIATVVWLLEKTLIRIGNEEYEKENKSYGLTTLKNKHITIKRNNTVQFEFKGKSGVYHKVDIKNKRIAAILRKCREIPGQDLFEYRDEDNQIQTITSTDVNEYLQEITGEDITAKDFRTWGGTIIAAEMLDKTGVCDEEQLSKKNIVEIVKNVAGHLRNKPNTCKKYYIHPSIIDAYTKGYVISSIEKSFKVNGFTKIEGLDEAENNVLRLLRHMVQEKPTV